MPRDHQKKKVSKEFIIEASKGSKQICIVKT